MSSARRVVSGSPAASKVNRPSPKGPSDSPTPRHKFDGRKDDICCFVFLHDNVHIVSGSRDATMRKWNCETGHLVGEPWKGHGGINALVLSPDGETIACGRVDGGVQIWNTDGDMIEGNWTGHGTEVRSLSWSPSGDQIASGSDNGTILIRRAESGEVEVGPIKTNQRWVCSLAYSPSGDRIASGGYNRICIWSSSTGELLVSQIEDLGNCVDSMVWSSDGSKLYSASDKFARVFEGTSGTELHRFQHDHTLYSIALSPKHNLLACAGLSGIPRLWSTESYQPLAYSFRQEDHQYLYYVSFSPDGQYLAYGGDGKKIALWTIQGQSATCLDVDATKPFAQSAEGGHNDLYSNDNFFANSQSSLPSLSSHTSLKHRLLRALPFSSLSHMKASQSIPSQEYPKRRFFTRRAQLKPPSRAPVTSRQFESTLKGKVRAENADEERVDVDTFNTLGTVKQNSDECRREEPILDSLVETPLHDGPSSPTTFNSSGNHALWNSWKSVMRASKDSNKAPVKMTQDRSVDVYAVRVPKAYVANNPRKRKTATSGPAQVGGSSHADLVSHVHTSSQGQGGPPSESIPSMRQATRAYCVDDSDSSSSIHGSCYRCLDKLCFPRGH